MSPATVKILKSVGSVIAAVLGGLAASNTFPSLTPFLSAASGLLAGWLQLPQPKAKEQTP